MDYYGIKLLSLFTDSVNGSQRNMNATPTNANNPDKDGDLLLDGYELFYGSDPLTFRTVTFDTDGDGLTDIQEQMFGVNLFFSKMTRTMMVFRIKWKLVMDPIPLMIATFSSGIVRPYVHCKWVVPIHVILTTIWPGLDCSSVIRVAHSRSVIKSSLMVSSPMSHHFLETSIREIIQFRLESIQCGSNM